jgi:hypothetical protein
MALKDWKKIGKNYWKKERHGGPLKLYVINSITRHGWIVELNAGVMVKKFKTKSQALKYARAYMRKH